jgi:hypothetical protein
MKDELQNTQLTITCLDKDGKIVKRVTSADTNDVEAHEGDNPSCGTHTGGGGNNPGGGEYNEGD